LALEATKRNYKVLRRGRVEWAEWPAYAVIPTLYFRFVFSAKREVGAAVHYSWLWGHGAYNVLRRYEDSTDVVDDVRYVESEEEVADFIAGEVADWIEDWNPDLVEVIVIAYRDGEGGAEEIAKRVAEKLGKEGFEVRWEA